MTFWISIPTYQRPDLLHRALRSLQAQTYLGWRAVVFDDSPAGEGRAVVRALGDVRVDYEQNTTRLGAATNIDRCFGPRLPGTDGWGYVLEDDNFLLPGFLEHAARVMTEHNPPFALFNQRVADPTGTLAPEARTTRGTWFAEGWVEPCDLHARLLLMEGLSNGGLVWRRGPAARLMVGPDVTITALHEACRSLRVRERFWFSATSLAVWTDFPRAQSARADEGHRVVTRGTQAITRFILRHYGAAAVELAGDLARARALTAQLVHRLLHAGALGHAAGVDRAETARSLGYLAKGCAVFATRVNPCGRYLGRLEQEWRAAA